jgi:hypothetical protein
VDYATVPDLVARWRDLTSEEETQAATALHDASVQLRRDVPDLVSRIATEQAARVTVLAAGGDDPGADLAETAKQVVCAMVRRAMDVDDGDAGVTAVQEAHGPFSRSRTFANPMGDLYTTKAERRRLGAGGQQAFTISTQPDPQPDSYAWMLR